MSAVARFSAFRRLSINGGAAGSGQLSRGMKPGLPVLTTVLNLCLISI
jgi:hypothetical protein